jgi:hypothetical protein
MQETELNSNPLVLQVVDNQLRENTPPETKKTYKRLCRQGYSDQQARELIGAVVSSEIVAVLQSKQPYDEARYIQALERLPELT